MSSAEQNAQVASAELPPGTEVGGYLIGQKVGEGGMGQVYSATHPVIGKKVAVKVLASHCVAVPDLVRRFIEEARAVNRIGHPNIVDIFSIGQLADGRHYMVMEFLEGRNLAQRIEQSTIPVMELRRLLGQICEALSAAHQAGIVHRDLKPENIWIVEKGNETSHIKLLDFGIAKLLGVETGRITQTGAAIGTPQFMPPEQCMGKPVDSRADIYSFGIILYLIFTGTLPFHGSTFAEIVYRHTSEPPAPPSRHRPLPPALERLILDCLQKDPDLRPATAKLLADRLDAALTGSVETPTVMVKHGPSAPPPPAQTPDWSRPATDPRPVEVTTPMAPRRSAGALVGLLGLAALAGGLVLARSGQVRPEALAASADAAEGRLRDAIAAQGRSLEPRAAEAARVRPLLSALELARDAPLAELKATLQDLFTDEEAWAPYRTTPTVTALVSDKGVLAALGPGFTTVAGAGVVRRARETGMASGLVAGQDRAFVVAAARVASKGPVEEAPVVLVGVPLDPAAFQSLSDRTGDAVGLARGGRLLESAGAPIPRAALTALVARPDRGVLLGESWAGTLMSVDGSALSLLSVFAVPGPPPASRAGIFFAAAGGILVMIAVALLFRRRRA